MFAQNYTQLLRWIYDEPVHVKPDLGKKPAFLNEEEAPKLETAVYFKRAFDAIKYDRPNKLATLNEYLEKFSDSLEQFRIQLSREDTVEKIIENLEQFLPYRNELTEIFFVIAQYAPEQDSCKILHRFFEKLLAYTLKSEYITSYTSWDLDNFKFIVHELYLYLQAVLLKYECFEAARYFIVNDYYVENARSETGMISYGKFRPYIESLESHGKQNRRLSFHADLLEQRAKSSGLDFSYLMQADFTLYLRDALEAVRSGNYLQWWPYSLLYLHNRNKPFEIYARAQSQAYFADIAKLLGIKSKNDFDILAQSIREGKIKIPQWEFTSFDPFTLSGYNNLASKE